MKKNSLIKVIKVFLGGVFIIYSSLNYVNAEEKNKYKLNLEQSIEIKDLKIIRSNVTTNDNKHTLDNLTFNKSVLPGDILPVWGGWVASVSSRGCMFQNNLLLENVNTKEKVQAIMQKKLGGPISSCILRKGETVIKEKIYISKEYVMFNVDNSFIVFNAEIGTFLYPYVLTKDGRALIDRKNGSIYLYSSYLKDVKANVFSYQPNNYPLRVNLIKKDENDLIKFLEKINNLNSLQYKLNENVYTESFWKDLE